MTVSFDWDEDKRIKNIAKHGIDFLQAASALRGQRLEFASDKNGERRTLAICEGTNKLIAVIYTMRGDVCRIISARVARKNEQRAYRQAYG